MLFQLLQKGRLLGKRLVHLGRLTSLSDPAFQDLQIREDQFQINRLNIPHRIDGPVHMHDIAVLKTTHHMHNSVHFPDIAQELIAQSFPLRCALYKPGDIHEFDGGRRHLLRLVHISQQLQSFIRHRHNADIRVDRAERIIGRFRSRFRQRIKKCALTHIWKSNDA